MTTRSTWRRRLARVGLVLIGCVVALLLVEAVFQIEYRITEREWLWSRREAHIFDWHPYLVGSPRPGATRQLEGKHARINALGFRGPEVTPQKPPGITRIVTLGGSSTFGTLVSDEDAWPRQLEARLGRTHQVVNLGVPGYSTVENLIQTEFLLSDLQPDIAIYYVGWNDVRNMHVRPLAGDYANFHGKQQLDNLDIVRPETGPRSAIAYYFSNWAGALVRKTLNADAVVAGDGEALTDRIDTRALSLYTRNLRSIVAVCRSLGIRPVFVPHLLNDDILTANAPYFWVPYVKTQDLPKAMRAYNDAMKEVAAELSVDFAEPVLHEKFGREEFGDEGHFNEHGSRRFAEILSRFLASLG